MRKSEKRKERERLQASLLFQRQEILRFDSALAQLLVLRRARKQAGQPTGGCVADCENFRKTCPYILPSGLASAVVRDTCGLGWSLCNDGDIPQLRHLIKIANDYVRDLEAKLAAQKQKVVG